MHVNACGEPHVRVRMNCGRMYVPDYFDFSIVHTYAGVYTYIFVSVYMCMAHRIQAEHACAVHVPRHTCSHTISGYGHKLMVYLDTHRIQTEHACVVRAPTHTITYMFTHNNRHYGYKLVPLKTCTRADAHSPALTIARMTYTHAMHASLYKGKHTSGRHTT
jgi:hypothetical protein